MPDQRTPTQPSDLQPVDHQHLQLVMTSTLEYRVRRDARPAIQHERLMDLHRKMMISYRDKNRANMQVAERLLAIH